MNIFVLDTDPKIAASYHCNKHVIKMILESVQMISTVLHSYGETRRTVKPGFQQHPCTLWAGRSKDNLKWLITLAIELDNQLFERYEKRHAFSELLEYFNEAVETLKFPYPEQGLTTFAIAMPDYLKELIPKDYTSEQAVQLYRKYYNVEKAYFASWKGSKEPEWFKPIFRLNHQRLHRTVIAINSKGIRIVKKLWK